MKKLKLKKILLLFSMLLAVVGCFLVKGVSVQASDDFIWSLDTVGTSNKDNIIFTEYIEEIDKVVCVTSNSSICFLDYESMEYSEEINIDGISTSINRYQICVCSIYLIVYDKEATKTNSLFHYIKINLKNLLTEKISTDINVAEDGNSTSSICSNDDKSFYISFFSYGMYDHTYIYKYFYEYNDKTLLLDISKNGLKYLTWADSNSFYLSSSFISNCDRYDKNSKSYVGNSYARKGYEFDNFTIFEPTQSNNNYFMILKDNNFKNLNYKPLSTSFIYLSFRVNNSIYILPYKNIGSIEALTINNFELSGERKLFCKYDKPQSYQDILSNYTPSDLYGRDLMMTLKADSYYNSFSTAGNYDATITVSDGYCHEDFEITIVVNKGGGEEEKIENSGSSIKWDTNLMIQSFGGIAVFLVIGLLVVTIIKKILR